MLERAFTGFILFIKNRKLETETNEKAKQTTRSWKKGGTNRFLPIEIRSKELTKEKELQRGENGKTNL